MSYPYDQSQQYPPNVVIVSQPVYGNVQYHSHVQTITPSHQIPFDQQPWLDEISSAVINQPTVCSSKLCARVQAPGGQEKEIDIRRSGCSCSNDYTIQLGDGSNVASVRSNIGIMMTGTKHIECPPGVFVASAGVGRTGCSKWDPYVYSSTVQGYMGAYLTHVVREPCDCGSTRAVLAQGRSIANISGPTPCCGNVTHITFDPSTTAIEKLIVIDICLTRLDFGQCNNPVKLMPILVSMAVFFVLFFFTLIKGTIFKYSDETTTKDTE